MPHKRYTQGRMYGFDEWVPKTDKRKSRKKHLKGRTSPLPAINPVTGATYQTYRPIDMQSLYADLRTIQKHDPTRRASFFALLGRAHQEKQVAWAEVLEKSGIGRAKYGTDEINGGQTVEGWKTYPEYSEVSAFVFARQLRRVRLDPSFPEVAENPKAMELFMSTVDTVLEQYIDPDFDRIAQELYTPFSAWWIADREPIVLIAAIGQMYNWHPETDADAFNALAGVYQLARIDFAALPDEGERGERLMRDEQKARDFGTFVSMNPSSDPADLWIEFVAHNGRMDELLDTDAADELDDLPF